MNLTRIAIERPSLIIVLFGLLFLGGIVAYRGLGVEMMPDFSQPVITIRTMYPGAAPEEVANSVTRPVEDALSALERVDFISSRSLSQRLHRHRQLQVRRRPGPGHAGCTAPHRQHPPGPARGLYFPGPSKENLFSWRLGSYGFNGLVFNVPPNLSSYSTRLDVRDSMGIFVDVLAGIDITENRAFWIFQAIDPQTGFPPFDPNLGILPLKDTTLNVSNDTLPAKGEGFASFTISPKNTVITGDTANAQADIIFDNNEPILTNIELNTFDALPPLSSILSGPISGNAVNLNISAADDAGGSGVKSYDLYVAQDSGVYVTYATNVTARREEGAEAHGGRRARALGCREEGACQEPFSRKKP